MNIAVSAQLIPGINGFPMSHRPLLHTRDVDQAIKFIHELAEPFRFFWDRSPARSDVMLTGVRLEKVNMFGVYQSASVLIRSAPLRSHYIVVPLQGDVVGTVHKEEFRAAEDVRGRHCAKCRRGCAACLDPANLPAVAVQRIVRGCKLFDRPFGRDAGEGDGPE